MKILLLFPMRDKQTGPAIKLAFEKLGHKVISVDAKRTPQLSFSVAKVFRPDLVFCSRTVKLVGEIEKIKKRFKDTVVCMWNVDIKGGIRNISGWTYLFPLVKLVDYYFVVDTGSIPRWRELNKNTFHLPQGVQSEVYHKPDEITEADRRKYSCDISFAGRDRRFRRPFLNAIDQMGVSFKRWGHRGAPKVFNEDHNKMVALSKINLCLSGWAENETCTSVRNYKILGAGGFALEFYREGMHDLFPLGTIVYYSDIKSLKRRIIYWLLHDETRNNRAFKSHKWVHANATYTHRIKKALEYMEL